MPLYELFCLARPQLAKAELKEVIKAASRAVFQQGGVITDLKSFGLRPLAHDIRKPSGKYNEVCSNVLQPVLLDPHLKPA